MFFQIISDAGFNISIGDYTEYLLTQPGETFNDSVSNIVLTVRVI